MLGTLTISGSLIAQEHTHSIIFGLVPSLPPNPTLFQGWLILGKPSGGLCTPTSFITGRSFQMVIWAISLSTMKLIPHHLHQAAAIRVSCIVHVNDQVLGSISSCCGPITAKMRFYSWHLYYPSGDCIVLLSSVFKCSRNWMLNVTYVLVPMVTQWN